MCCSSFLKCMMFVFNGGVFLTGAVVLGVGVWARVDSDSLLGLVEEDEDVAELTQLVNGSYALITVGAVLLIMGFLGCCGAIRESKCMLLTFFSILLIIFLIEIAGAVVLFAFSGLTDALFRSLENKMAQKFKRDYGQDEAVTSVWNDTMDNLKCCGISNYTDFIGSPFYNDNGNAFPTACCNSTDVDQCNEFQAEHANVEGCLDRLLQLIEDNAVIIAGVALAIAALQIAAMVVSMVLYCRIGKRA